MNATRPIALSEAQIAQLAAAVADDRQRLVGLRRRLHRTPELGWREFKTTAVIVEELVNLGYEVTSGHDLLKNVHRLGLSDQPAPDEGNTGCVGIWDTGRPGTTVCLRVDIDALPITEAESRHRPADEGWASSISGVMHACGHDGHAAIGLGVARALAPLWPTLSGRCMLLFQPAEEGGRGARAVVDAGWMEGVDLFLAVHIGLGLPSDTIGLGVGGFLATRKYRTTLTGRPAHAGKAPQTGANALLAACQISLALHGFAQSSDPGTRVNVGTLQAGTSLNIVPDHAVVGFEIRASTTEQLEDLDKRCHAAIEHGAAAYGVGCQTELRGEAEDWENDPQVVERAEAVNQATGAFSVAVRSFDFGASEDATLLARSVTDGGGRAAIFVAGADLSDGHHTERFDFDEGVLSKSVLFLSALIADALHQPRRTKN